MMKMAIYKVKPHLTTMTMIYMAKPPYMTMIYMAKPHYMEMIYIAKPD